MTLSNSTFNLLLVLLQGANKGDPQAATAARSKREGGGNRSSRFSGSSNSAEEGELANQLVRSSVPGATAILGYPSFQNDRRRSVSLNKLPSNIGSAEHAERCRLPNVRAGIPASAFSRKTGRHLTANFGTSDIPDGAHFKI